MKLSNLTPLILTFLASCAGVGMVYSSDPHEKLQNARVLYQQQNRPLAANRLIVEVITTCEESKDRVCLADAWVAYGLLLQSESAERWENEHGKMQFPANRYKTSAEYLEKAAIVFNEQKLFDKATNAYFNQGLSFELDREKTEACASYSKSLDAYKKNIEQNPSVKPFVPSGYTNYEDFLAAQRKRVGCQ